MLPGFYQPCRGRKPRSVQQRFAKQLFLLKQKSFKQMAEIFDDYIPRKLLKPEKHGIMSRRRIFSKENILRAFVSQVLDADGGCKEVFVSFSLMRPSKELRFLLLQQLHIVPLVKSWMNKCSLK